MPAEYLALIAAGAGTLWWLRLRGARNRALPAPTFDEDAGIAIHVARHEVKTRRQRPSTLHVLYGLLQVEVVTEAIAASGGDVAALDDRVLDELAAAETGDDDALHELLGRVAAIAHHANRPISCVDLWAHLGRSRAATVLAAAGIERGAVLFRLVHGEPEPDLAPALTSDVFVILRNDPYSTMEFVVDVLVEDFALARDQATTIMTTAHTTGRATVGRYALTVARAKVIAARARAHDGEWPLWIGVEPA